MQNKIDYISHKLYTPDYYHRQFQNDLPENKEDSRDLENGKRIVQIALPFISLYKPAGTFLSAGMGSVRVLTSGMDLLNAENLDKTAYSVIQVGLAALALAGTLYQFTLGLYITTAADIIANLTHIIQHIQDGELEKIVDELMQAATSSLYLAIFMTGSLEVVLASIFMQAAMSFYQCQAEWKNGRYPEALAKFAMGLIRLNQAKGQFDLIQRRNDLLRRHRLLAERLQNGRKIEHLWDHPLARLAEAVDQKRVILKDAEGNEYDFGAHYSGVGKQAIKGMNITFKDEGDDRILEFKVNHVFRDRLEQIIADTKKASGKDMQDLLKIFGSHIEKISFSKNQLVLSDHWWMEGTEEHEIHLKGLGKIFIGASTDTPNLYDRIRIQMDKGKNLYDFHEALSFFQLEDALKQSAEEDFDRMKIGQLFRIFNPREATYFERSDQFFDLPINELKVAICKLDPNMKGVFEKYISRMELREILPGRMRFAISGLANELKAEGARGLTAALTGVWGDDKEARNRVISILKMGMLSTELRDGSGLGKLGLGSDYQTGGADSVYTQIVTKNNESYSDFGYQAPIRFLFSPKVLETGTYQYHDDNLGTRLMPDNDSIFNFWWGFDDDYINRPDIFSFVQDENDWFMSGNEVMIKERIPPEYITGIVLQSETLKQKLIEDMRRQELFKLDAHGNETIFGKRLDGFFLTEKKIKDEHFVS